MGTHIPMKTMDIVVPCNTMVNFHYFQYYYTISITHDINGYINEYINGINWMYIWMGISIIHYIIKPS